MIWATVSSWPFFCWLYSASPSLAAKNIINLISVLTIWCCPCVEFSCTVGRVCFLWPVHSLGKTISLWPALFCTPRSNSPGTPGMSWLPTFAFQFPIIVRECLTGGFLRVVSHKFCVPYQFLFWEWVELHAALRTETMRNSICLDSFQ